MIMRGFGLSAGICWRGTQDETHPMHFAWVGPDGGKMAYHKLTDKGSYSPFEFAVRDPLRAEGYTDESYAKHFDVYFAEESARTVVPLLLMLDAIDHTRPDHEMPKILQAAADAGASFAGYDLLRLPGAVRTIFERWLEVQFPDRKAKVLHRLETESCFGERRAGGGIFSKTVDGLFEAGKRKAGLSGRGPALSTASFRRPSGPQLDMDLLQNAF